MQIEVAGQRYPLQMRIAEAGSIIGCPSRSSSYRAAEADDWPLCGPPSSRHVLLGQLLERLGIPFEYVASEEAPDEARP